jgi:chorismate mutase
VVDIDPLIGRRRLDAHNVEMRVRKCRRVVCHVRHAKTGQRQQYQLETHLIAAQKLDPDLQAQKQLVKKLNNRR